jgi:hypothetical protein
MRPDIKVIHPLDVTPDEFQVQARTSYLIGIPDDWHSMKDNDPDTAIKWRQSSDRLFTKLLRTPHGKKLPTHRVTTLIQNDTHVPNQKNFLYIQVIG